MLEIILIFILGLTPPVVSVWTRRKAEAQARSRLVGAMESAARRSIQRLPLPSSQYEPDEIALPIGDRTCRFNARSAFIRCAVNPSGPCQSCSHYQRRE